MITFFNEIANIIDIIIGYVLGMIRLMLVIPKGIMACMTWISNVLQYMPNCVLMFALFVIAFGLVFQVLNKGS